jgi:hypothetical protein
MISHVSPYSTIYAAGRLALEYVNPYLPSLGENTSRVARKALFF